jgi:hypothetical protein
MFLLNTNDLPFNFQGVKSILSDDTNIFVVDKNKDHLQQKNKYAMKELEAWFQKKKDKH